MSFITWTQPYTGVILRAYPVRGSAPSERLEQCLP